MAGEKSVIVIGAGSTGCAIAHDLALRGLRVTVVERGGVASGTTGHNQAQLHSGARYVVHDPESARECIQENRILRQILPEGMELTGGLFAAFDEEQLAFRPIFLEACADCGIETREISPQMALQMEPRMNPEVLAAIQVPADAVIDPYRLCLSFLASACQHGARVLTFSEVVGIDASRGQVQVRARKDGANILLQADLIVNAAGPWASKVANLAGAEAAIEPSAGAMVTVVGRLCNQVLNLLAPAGDGDILVPQRQSCILGTTSWSIADPDQVVIPEGHIELLYRIAEIMVPGVRKASVRGVMAAVRPLLVVPGAGGRQTTRAFACLDHSSPSAGNFISIVGGKTTTARLMAEKLSDLVCKRLGIQAECRTRQTVLASYRLGWAG